MRRRDLTAILAVLVVGIVGCSGGSTSEDSAPDSTTSSEQAEAGVEDTSDPAAAVTVFLEALCQGDDETILSMYTQKARDEAAEYDEHFAPKGSDTRTFQVGEVEFLASDGARVASVCTDLDAAGNLHTDQITWMVRQETSGWRIAGMAATVFPGEPPVLLDFEDLGATLEKVELLAQEVRRRHASEPMQANQPPDASEPIRR